MTSNSQKLRILLVEDHPTMRGVLVRALEELPEVTVAGEAATGAEALEFCRKQTFDLVLLDTRLPDMNGTEVIRALRKEDTSGIKILGMSVKDDAFDREPILRAGADAFVSKLDGLYPLYDAVRAFLPSKDGGSES